MANLHRIKEIILKKNLSIKEVSRDVGITEQALLKIIRENSTKIETLEKIAMKLNVSPKIFFDDTDIVEEKKTITLPSKSIETRPRIPYEAAAGRLSMALDGVKIDDCEQVPIVRSFPDYDYSIFARGDSMEGELKSGDELFCKSIINTHFVQWGRMHVLDTSQGIVVKRIFDNENDILCKSELCELYKDFNIPKNEVYNIGLIIGMIRRY